MSSDPDKKIWLLFNCLDWRLHPQVENYFLERHDGCDLCVTAGSLKGLIEEETRGYFLEQIEISKKLHNCQGVILTMHMDCGAYGGSKNFESKAAETTHYENILGEAKKIVLAAFPDLAVEKYIIELESSDGGWLSKPVIVG
ncbi:MAG TPA: hypothetical protein P5080_01170 [Candidatus Paceibacterota bacterium]|nr:hypothetical protein [Candidatus Pacearchaeota archaeon]HRZ50583.1 hypothetical protein [Candidatus Paceibacterota bacterium]HSA36304.1 hypothetical protein [Candidatus Paceibacterota bacterium]